MMKAAKDLEELAKQEGLDCFPTIFEFVNKDIMLEACSYGLPVRARHWSYGRSYDHQKLYGEMGFSKVYEIVFNNDPSYAFLLNTNTWPLALMFMVVQYLVIFARTSSVSLMSVVPITSFITTISPVAISRCSCAKNLIQQSYHKLNFPARF